jgi:hypothetical protein
MQELNASSNFVFKNDKKVFYVQGFGGETRGKETAGETQA